MGNIDMSLMITAKAKQDAALRMAREDAWSVLDEAIARAIVNGVGDAPLAEQLSWSKKEAAARAYLEEAATEAQMAMLEAEAAETGETLAELASRIVQKADAQMLLVARLTGIRRALMVEIAAVASIEGLELVLEEIEGIAPRQNG